MQVDFAVVGAGPAGATVARLLAGHGKDVVLFDTSGNRTDRLELLAPRACTYAVKIGLGRLLDDAAMALECTGIRRTWGNARAVEENFMTEPGGRGVVVDRTLFDASLRLMAAQAGARLCRLRLVGAASPSHSVTLKLSDRDGAITTIEAGMVVDATGRAAVVSRRLGARRLLRERRVAMRLVSPEPAQAEPAEQGSDWLHVNGDMGSWSYAILGAGGRRDCWRIMPSLPRGPSRAGAIRDATSSVLEDAAGHNWIAVGDAAATFDPITSQGLYNALSTATVAVGAILSAGGFDAAKAAAYSHAVRENFWATERGRLACYRDIEPNALTS